MPAGVVAFESLLLLEVVVAVLDCVWGCAWPSVVEDGIFHLADASGDLVSTTGGASLSALVMEMCGVFGLCVVRWCVVEDEGEAASSRLRRVLVPGMWWQLR